MRQGRSVEHSTPGDRNQRVPVIDFLRGRSRSDARSRLLYLHQVKCRFCHIGGFGIDLLTFVLGSSKPSAMNRLANFQSPFRKN